VKFHDGPSVVLAAYDTSGPEEAPAGEAQRVGVIRIITLIAVIISALYIVGYAMMGWWALVAYSAPFPIIYALTHWWCIRGKSRLAGVVLIGAGIIQLCGVSTLFLAPLGGTQIFIALLPIFALVTLSPRDRNWARAYIFIAGGFLVWIEFARDTYVPPYDVGMNADLIPTMRALAMTITVAMIVGVFNHYLKDLKVARKKLRYAHEQSESLILNILPASIAKRLKRHEVTIADDYDDASVLFADLVGFTALSAKQTASETVTMLNAIVSAFDVAVVAHGVEKIKTIGDAYMAAAGVPTHRPDHAVQMLYLALAMQSLLEVHNARTGHALELRIGVNSGPVTAGVIGARKFSYDLWGNTVNVASRMESTGIPGRIQVSEPIARATKDHFTFEDRGLIEVKGKGKVHTFLLVPPE